MKNFSWKKVVPHLIAIGIFLVVALIYCRPALEGKVLQQNDIVHWKGMAQNSFAYKERTGHFPLWNTTLFGGMPAYQIALEGKAIMPNLHSAATLWLPAPAAFFFFACICFYVLTQVLGIQYVIGILASLGFAYASYDPVIIVAGHESKMWAMACMPAVLAGLLLIYNKRYLVGLALTALTATWQIGFNHPQVSYYFFIAAGIITLGFLVQWIRAKEWKHLVVSLSLALFAGFIAFANTSMTLLTTQEYAKYTMRGGKQIDIQGSEIKKVNTKGLDLDYAFSYSIGKDEILTFIAPNVFGGGSSESMGDDQHFIDALVKKDVPEQSAMQLASGLPKYWGGISEGTSGPVYLGGVVVLLALIALVVVKQPLRWYILAAAVFTIFIAWGKYFAGFNTILYNYLPLFNKFRAPSMALIIPQLLFPLLAAMALQEIFFTADGAERLKKSFKPILYVIGGLIALVGILYLFNDFSGGIDDEILKAYGGDGGGGAGRTIVSALQESRKAMFLSGLGRVIFFAALVTGLLFLYIRKAIQPVVAVVIFLLINTIDLLIVDSKYLNSDHFVDKEDYTSSNFTPSAANTAILQDKDPHYRVYNLAPDRFSDAITSYFHRSVGGYHAAKLAIYQDLIAGQLSKSPLNMAVLNMLDTRYFIIPAQQQRPTPMVEKNDGALGAAWFVKGIRSVNGPVEEMKALDKFNPQDTAIVDKSAFGVTDAPVYDSAASISLVKYDNDAIQYNTQSASKQFAVFSEIYYPAGWNAYIDGQKAPYVKANYVLRGMAIPAGKHTIDFRFEPQSFKTGQTLVYVGNILLLLSLALGVFAIWKQNKKEKAI
ncbi:YfhO family protein [Filimonas effusa]|uniref:YfhO family protein n=1 Tax=Filimonas effusa TaxID=2508721 RepID=A0A4Q1D989_9BACT|nr:YfhO family protein [Filimonas effusa]RXK85932.1 hypothetical protein ESB13_03730 [Filimonas effusa]